MGKDEFLLEQFKSVFRLTTDNKLPTTRIGAQNNITQITIDQKGLENVLKTSIQTSHLDLTTSQTAYSKNVENN